MDVTSTLTQSAASTVQPTDAQLQKFAQASQKIAVVVEEYQPKLHASPDDSARQQDPQLRQRVIDLVNRPGG